MTDAKPAPLPSCWVFKLDPWDAKAKKIADALHKGLSPNFRMLVKGRGPRGAGYRQSIPLDKAKYVVIYIYGKTVDDRLPTMRVPPPKERKPRKKQLQGGSLGSMIRKLEKLEGKSSV
jgi:hypothetical protein